MIHLLGVTAFNAPRLTRLSGAGLALLIGVVHLWVRTHSTAPEYVDTGFAAVFALAFAAALALLAGYRKLGWPLAATASCLVVSAYTLSRTVGLPRYADVVGAWHEPLGTLACVLALALLGLHASVLFGWNVDRSGARDWDTYFSRS